MRSKRHEEATMASNPVTAHRSPERSLHHRLFHRLVSVAPGSTTAELQLMYEGLAPLVYRGTTWSSVQRRWRRKVLSDLSDSGAVDHRDTPRGRVWFPVTLPDGLDVRRAATDARRNQCTDGNEGTSSGGAE